MVTRTTSSQRYGQPIRSRKFELPKALAIAAGILFVGLDSWYAPRSLSGLLVRWRRSGLAYLEEKSTNG